MYAMENTDVLAEFRATFQLERLSVLETGYWVLSVRPGQLTLGSMVLSSARGVLHFAELNQEEGQSLAYMLGLAEKTARELFGAVRINAVCLMMKDPVIHFHLLPRYDQSLERYGTQWMDSDWPGPPVFQPVQTPEHVLEAIKEDIAAWINHNN